MISKGPQLDRDVIDRIIAFLVREMETKYRIKESEDCKSFLNGEVAVVLNSTSFKKSKYQKAYFKRCLWNAANQFYQSRFRQVKGEFTNKGISGLATEVGAFRDKQNRFCNSDQSTKIDINEFLLTCTEIERNIFLGKLNDETFESIGGQLGVSKQNAHKRWMKIARRAKRHFKEYEDECC